MRLVLAWLTTTCHRSSSAWPIVVGATAAKKKADVVEHPKAFDHVGLLVNKPPGTAGLLFI
jgi:hypothetical protein